MSVMSLMYHVNYLNRQQISHNSPTPTLSHSFLHLRVSQGQVAGDEGGDKGGAEETSGETEGSDGEAAAAFITQI